MLTGLSRCPICRNHPSSRRGCCGDCAADLFSPEVGGSIVLGAYGGKLEKAVRAFKFHGATRLGEMFAVELARLVEEQSWSVDAVCAVPLHRKRYWKRGYNQADLLAKGVARHLNVPHLNLLKRTRATRQQARLSRLERLNNVEGAFEPRSLARSLRNRDILLLDDVITSGATLQACREALLGVGVKTVKVAAVAKAQA